MAVVNGAQKCDIKCQVDAPKMRGYTHPESLVPQGIPPVTPPPHRPDKKHHIPKTPFTTSHFLKILPKPPNGCLIISTPPFKGSFLIFTYMSI